LTGSLGKHRKYTQAREILQRIAPACCMSNTNGDTLKIEIVPSH